jgi:hypothetical protein
MDTFKALGVINWSYPMALLDRFSAVTPQFSSSVTVSTDYYCALLMILLEMLRVICQYSGAS